MLKFQSNYTTSICCFEEFFIMVYVLIDALYQHYVSESVFTRCNSKNSKIITISLCRKIPEIDSENAWYVFKRKELWSFISKPM